MVSLALPVSAATSAEVVSLSAGQIRGSLLKQGGAVFKGIPFAQPPLGQLRWRPPAPVKPWTGERDATRFGAPCSQNANGRVLEQSSEDCLFLNVWTPEWPARTKKPVMFWIHGGGNYAGTASSVNFDGESLARHGVILVTANYRLTIFGFFAYPELTRESSHHASGNYGLMDQIAALQWVHDNIAAFGGDPGNVTVFGQSAGAVDASVLMTSPLTKGLFHRVIAESGTVTRNPDDATLRMTALGAAMKVKNGPVTFSDAPSLTEAERAGEELAGILQAPTIHGLKFLRQLPAADLLKAVGAPRMSIGPANGIEVDGWVLPKPPAEVFARGREHGLPMLIGNNSRERTPPQATQSDLQRAVEGMYGPLASRAFALYGLDGTGERQTDDPLYGGQAAQWVVDTMYRCPVVAQLIWHAAKNPAWEYQFDRAAPAQEALGAVHGAEVAYVFGALDAPGRRVTYVAADREISAAMQEYWTNFAKTGNPNSASTLPQWPRFDATARGYMEFTDRGPVAGEGLRRPFCDLYIENVKRLMAP
jgi:para-nitrobenzyl esterase